METNDFTAVSMCPQCHKVDIHRFRLANTKRNSTLVRKLNGVEIHAWGGYTDPRWAVVMRQCACGKEWGQK